jgi:hypothetical protein
VQDIADIPVDVYRLVDIRLLEREIGVALEALEVRGRAGDEVVQRQDAVAGGEQRLAEMGADEAGSAGDDCTRLRARVTRGRNLCM